MITKFANMKSGLSKAAMGAIAAAWGYLGSGAMPHDWGADAVLDEPGDLLKFLKLA